MAITRRNLLKASACTGALLACGSSAQAAREAAMPAGALGILYDSSLCIGCQACMVGCKQANDMEPDPEGGQTIWDNPADLSSRTLTVIKKYEEGKARTRNQTKDGFAFVKLQCMHCADPACVSACPVSAMTKDAETGIVSYNKKACIGCRYCQIACPYNIPKFEWHKPLPQIVKCELCRHLIAKGGISACCASCPTGASLFGPVELLKEEAHRRLLYEAGHYYEFPLHDIRSGRSVVQPAALYKQKLYGEKELGGSQVMLLSAVDFHHLGMPELPDKSYASTTETIQHTLYKGMFLPVALLGGLVYFVKKNAEKLHDDE
ncbi:MAG: hydrogenase 2 protein HybA [Desulfobulbaceae bacterium]|nr:MAG: hydrogenase 2 protein HybA [Desulfobulbaceae bacterium]